MAGCVCNSQITLGGIGMSHRLCSGLKDFGSIGCAFQPADVRTPQRFWGHLDTRPTLEHRLDLCPPLTGRDASREIVAHWEEIKERVLVHTIQLDEFEVLGDPRGDELVDGGL